LLGPACTLANSRKEDYEGTKCLDNEELPRAKARAPLSKQSVWESFGFAQDKIRSLPALNKGYVQK